ncbi:MAG: transglutaminase-like domain-containing protein [Gammaproteobacteria bacterium]
MINEDPFQVKPRRYTLTPQDFASLSVTAIGQRFKSLFADEQERARAIHDFVRQHILFGFCLQFDSTPTSYTLKRRLGHGTAQTNLFITLLRAADIEAYAHFVIIRKDLLYQLLPKHFYERVPDRISHAYAEVNVKNVWCRLDSYIMDDQLIKFAKNRLIQSSWEAGYGVHVRATNFWDGKSDAFCQLVDPDHPIEDHGRQENIKSYFRSQQYPHRFFGISYSRWFQLGFQSQMPQWMKETNERIDRIRHNQVIRVS